MFLRLVVLFASLTFAGAFSNAAPAATILALGDSLTAGYGLAEADGFVPRLDAALQEMGRDVTVINAGVSGDTSAGGLTRIEWALQDRPSVMILELGANDMLRGIDPAATKANLEAIVVRAKEAGVTIVLVGMQSTENFGADYKQAFDSIYPDLARRHQLILMPFFLEGVAADPKLNQADGLHPNADGVGVIVRNALPYVLTALDRAVGKS